jgi:hypothetical protein
MDADELGKHRRTREEEEEEEYDDLLQKRREKKGTGEAATTRAQDCTAGKRSRGSGALSLGP